MVKDKRLASSLHQKNTKKPERNDCLPPDLEQTREFDKKVTYVLIANSSQLMYVKMCAVQLLLIRLQEQQWVQTDHLDAAILD